VKDLMVPNSMESLKSIRYGHLATCHLIFDLSKGGNDVLKEISDDKLLHLLIPDSFYANKNRNVEV